MTLEEFLKDARVKLEELEYIDNCVFHKDRVTVIKSKQEEILNGLEEHIVDHLRDKRLHSEYLYLKGKTLDFLPEFQKEAEELLAKAIKLRPSWHEPLNALGHVYWKKKDFENAEMCYRQAIEENPDDTKSLRDLSMVI